MVFQFQKEQETRICKLKGDGHAARLLNSLHWDSTLDGSSAS